MIERIYEVQDEHGHNDYTLQEVRDLHQFWMGNRADDLYAEEYDPTFGWYLIFDNVIIGYEREI